MVWSDEPTDAQLNAVYHWLSWGISSDMARKATDWLFNTATRKEVSDEMSRLKELYDTHTLDEKTCFASEIWEGFDNMEDDYE